MTDLEIARKAKMQPITEIAKKAGLLPEEVELYGNYKAKISDQAFKRTAKNKDGKLILVTAITPTKAGEGKSTTTIGLGCALQLLKKNAFIVIREPSLGPVMGIKGGANGGGYAQVVPSEEINLHFTGDIHAVTTANNLISNIIDNSLHQGNPLNIDSKNITWKRCLDSNDRSLRDIIVGLGTGNGVVREDHFIITVASEIMAVLCLAKDFKDLRVRLGRIIVGYSYTKQAITVNDLKITGALLLLLKDAFKPNLVQTLENTPVLIHGGPFANIAHGCNSVKATKLALKLSDYVITEAGFAADLGAEKFLDIKCRLNDLKPACVVLVATIRALKMHGGAEYDKLNEAGIEYLKVGMDNLAHHLETIEKYGLPKVVCLNRFYSDTEEEIQFVTNWAKEKNINLSLSEVFAKGGKGGIDLAEKVLKAIETEKNDFKLIYDDSMLIKEKFKRIAKNVYGADDIVFSTDASREINRLQKSEFKEFPICMAKTPLSISDNPKLLNRPKGFKITINSVRVSAGAGFIIGFAGAIMTMPGLPKVPQAEKIDIDDDFLVTGLM